MNRLAAVLRWMLKAVVFFTLFAFALNNPHTVTVNWFFGAHWDAPLVLVVLCVFTFGVAVGVVGMFPRWWRDRRARRRRHDDAAAPSAPGVAEPTAAGPNGL